MRIPSSATIGKRAFFGSARIVDQLPRDKDSTVTVESIKLQLDAVAIAELEAHGISRDSPDFPAKFRSVIKEWAYGTGHWTRAFFREQGLVFNTNNARGHKKCCWITEAVVLSEVRNIPAVMYQHAKTVHRCELSGVLLREDREVDHAMCIARYGSDPDYSQTPLETLIDKQHPIFLVVDPDANKRKREACGRCIKTGQRSPIMQGKMKIAFWSTGTGIWDDAVKCSGCFQSQPAVVLEAFDKVSQG